MGLLSNKRKEGALLKIIAEPRAWIRKYFNEASAEYWLNLEEIIGMKDRRFNSNPSQAVNQEEEEKVIRVPKIRVKKKRTWAGLSIKKRSSLHRRGMSP